MKLRYHLLHYRPRQIERRVDELYRAGVIAERPNLWQLWLGVLYMWHRVFFRPETIGLSSDPVRPTHRARVFRWRPFRTPFLVGRVNPLDHTGLGSSTAHTVRHLLGAHHDADAFHYDLALIAHEPGVLESLEERLLQILDGSAPDADFLRDLCVYEGYHQALLDGVRAWRHDQLDLDEEDPDITLTGFVRWCTRQPASLRETLTRGVVFA